VAHNDRFSRLREAGAAGFLCASVLGAGFASGREVVAFFAQTGIASWLGILLCACFYGSFVGLTARFARRTGSESFPCIFRRTLGVYAGGTVGVLHVLALAIMSWIALTAVGQAGALLLPFSGGYFVAICLSLLLSAAVAPGNLHRMGIVLLILLTAWLCALMIFGTVPDAAEIYLHTKLRLDNSPLSASLLALLYACRSAAVSASAVARLSADARPCRLGACAGAMLALLLCLANACLRGRPLQLMALRQPFSAMAVGWGSAGYGLGALMLWFCGTTTVRCMLLSFSALLRDGKNGC